MNLSLRININDAAIQRKISQALTLPKISRIAYMKAYQRFLSAKQFLLQQFDIHDVTNELLMGPKGVNLTNALDGYGNLYSFLGFPIGEKPTNELRRFLESSLSFRQTIYNNRIYFFRVTLPSLLDIYNETPLPWDSEGSWVEAVERGLDNFPQYLFKQWEHSRSTMGIQLPEGIEINEDLQQKPIKYMSELLQNFRQKINISR